MVKTVQWQRTIVTERLRDVDVDLEGHPGEVLNKGEQSAKESVKGGKKEKNRMKE